jgi:hypothetical protein
MRANAEIDILPPDIDFSDARRSNHWLDFRSSLGVGLGRPSEHGLAENDRFSSIGVWLFPFKGRKLKQQN